MHHLASGKILFNTLDYPENVMSRLNFPMIIQEGKNYTTNKEVMIDTEIPRCMSKKVKEVREV